MTVRVENNFIDNNFFFEVCTIITDPKFPWHIKDSTNDLVHDLIYEPSLKKENSFYATKILDPIIVKLNLKSIVSSRLTLNFRRPSFEKNLIQEEVIDVNNKSLRGFIAINSSNSEIEIVGVNKFSLVENRFISFSKNNTYFTSSHTDKKFKIVLEIIYNQ